MANRIFSGVQPSGNLHIGNYLGAIKNWVKLQNEYDSVFCIVDLHAITVPQDPEKLRKNIIELAKVYLACGVNPEKSSIFIQSHVQEHTELTWILNTIAKNGELSKMTQFKSKANFSLDDLDVLVNDIGIISKKIKELQETSKNIPSFGSNSLMGRILPIDGMIGEFHEKINQIKLIRNQFNKVGMGLYDYPVLMAADIILYDTEKVPVGEDQVQHVELTRTLGKRFNSKFGETFVIPEPLLVKEGMRIMGLDDPSKKMSKSAGSEYNYIALTDDAEAIRKKIKKAVTDSGSEIIYNDDKPALKNLINIYAGFSGKDSKEIEKMYAGKGYADFKNDLAEVIIQRLKPIQEKINSLSDEEVLKILQAGAEKVRPLAQKKMKEVKNKIGFII